MASRTVKGSEFRTAGIKSRGGIQVAAGAVALAATVVGVLHLPFARAMLARVGGCPVMGARMTAQEMERARHIALATERGERAAPHRPALGFALDATTLADVRAWARGERADCRDPHPGLVVCVHVPPGAVGGDAAEGAIDELVLGFDTQGRLVNETTLRAHLSPGAASRAATTIVASLEAQLGLPAKSAGGFDPAHLRGSPSSSISTVSYRYTDYVADIVTMSLPDSGSLIREHYMSAND